MRPIGDALKKYERKFRPPVFERTRLTSNRRPIVSETKVSVTATKEKDTKDEEDHVAMNKMVAISRSMEPRLQVQVQNHLRLTIRSLNIHQKEHVCLLLLHQPLLLIPLEEQEQKDADNDPWNKKIKETSLPELPSAAPPSTLPSEKPNPDPWHRQYHRYSLPTLPPDLVEPMSPPEDHDHVVTQAPLSPSSKSY